MTFKKMKFRFILFLFIIIFGFYYTYKLFNPTKIEPNYITTKVQKGNIELAVLADGKVNAFKLVNVGAQVSGQINKLHVKLGDNVKVGDLIAEIDDVTQKNNLKQAEAALLGLEAQRKAKEVNLKNYLTTYNRQLQLLKQGGGTQSELDKAEAQLDIIKADITALEAEMIRAKIAVDNETVKLGYTKITSPINGKVVSVPVEEGQTVNSFQIAPTIVKVAQLDKMTVEAQISEADVIKIKSGMPVYFKILGSNKRFDRLNLRAIEPAPNSINSDSLSSSTSTAIYYNGLFDVNNPDQILRISMTAQVYIVLAKAENVLYIPSTAILQEMDNGKARVHVLDENKQLITKEISIGIDNNVNVEVKSGLNLDETIVLGSNDGLTMNTPAKIRIR